LIIFGNWKIIAIAKKKKKKKEGRNGWEGRRERVPRNLNLEFGHFSQEIKYVLNF
jgi:hypothetical protein